MTEVLTYLERLREIALDQHGFVTTLPTTIADCIEAGTPTSLLLPGFILTLAHEYISGGAHRPELSRGSHHGPRPPYRQKSQSSSSVATALPIT